MTGDQRVDRLLQPIRVEQSAHVQHHRVMACRRGVRSELRGGPHVALRGGSGECQVHALASRGLGRGQRHRATAGPEAALKVRTSDGILLIRNLSTYRISRQWDGTGIDCCTAPSKGRRELIYLPVTEDDVCLPAVTLPARSVQMLVATFGRCTQHPLDVKCPISNLHVNVQ